MLLSNESRATALDLISFIGHCHAWRQDGATVAQEYPELVKAKK